jgi:hypothetical protein
VGPAPGRAGAWLVVVALLFPVALLNYLDRQMIASMKVSRDGRHPDIGSEANWGHMLASFKWVYAIFSPIGGYIADRFSRADDLRQPVRLVAHHLVDRACGQLQRTYWARTLMGISEAFYIPAALALIADYHTGGTRSRAVGVHQMGIYCGVMVGGFAGYVADAPDLGWRWAFDFLRHDRHPLRDPAAASAARCARQASRNERWRRFRPPSVGAAAELLATAISSCSCSTSRCPRSPGGWCATGCPRFCKRAFNISQGKAGVSASSTGRMAALIGAIRRRLAGGPLDAAQASAGASMSAPSA